MDDAEKRCFEQQDKLQVQPALPDRGHEARSAETVQALLLGSLANVPGLLDVCQTSPEVSGTS